MQKNSRLIWLMLVGMAAFIGYLILQNQTIKKESSAKSTVVQVKSQTAELSNLKRQVQSLGTVLASESIQVVSNASDYITVLNINEGQTVEKGALLVQLHDVEERARVAELTAQLTEQKRQLDRLKNLTRTQASAQSLLDEQQAKVNTTLAQLDAVKARLNDLTIKAPFSGVLGLRRVSQGAYVSAGTVLTTLDDLSQVRVEFSVAEQYLAQLKPGMQVSSDSVAYPGQPFEGQIKAIDTRLDPISRSVRVHAMVPNPDQKLRPGMLLTVKVTLDQQPAIQISEKALVPLKNKQYVYVIQPDNTVVQTEVEIGQRLPGLVEISQGLTPGQQVVVEGTQKLQTGTSVTVVE
ncbi:MULTISPECIES: efflux RND transporter periplasmic adaptor subunit [Rheinheimera]|uniref:Efflux RND transporter periplasmic adaptor subunit n=1 Tax=Rheinheimera marina TaxID=1774958 RepID=A0ABV9JK33_9GAMM